MGADPASGPIVLEAIRQVKIRLGVNLILAASNISFGLPDRVLLNNAFIAMAIASSATCVITDVGKVRPTILAADLIMNHDNLARRYIEAYRNRQKS